MPDSIAWSTPYILHINTIRRSGYGVVHEEETITLIPSTKRCSIASYDNAAMQQSEHKASRILWFHGVAVKVSPVCCCMLLYVLPKNPTVSNVIPICGPLNTWQHAINIFSRSFMYIQVFPFARAWTCSILRSIIALYGAQLFLV